MEMDDGDFMVKDKSIIVGDFGQILMINKGIVGIN